MSAGASNAVVRQAHRDAGAPQRVRVARPQCDVAVPTALRLSSAGDDEIRPRRARKLLARATAQFPSRLVCCQLQAAATSRPAAACMRWLGGASSGVRAGAFPHAHGIFDSAAPRALSRGHGRYSAVRSPERRCINEVTNAYTRAQHKQRALFDANLMLTATSVCGVARARTHARHRPEALVRHRCHRNIVFCRGAPS